MVKPDRHLYADVKHVPELRNVETSAQGILWHRAITNLDGTGPQQYVATLICQYRLLL